MAWYSPTKLDGLLKLKQQFPQAKVVLGNTEVGIEQRILRREYPVVICPSNVEVSAGDGRTVLTPNRS